MVDGWKISTIVLAVVCFFLLVAVVIEAIALVVFFAVGAELDDMEVECANEICSSENYTYFFDDDTETCYCYSGDEVVLKQQVEW